MDWIFDHFGLLILIGSAIAYTLSKKKAEVSEADLPPKRDVRPVDDDLTRRLREEILRKREERLREAMQPVPPEPLPAPASVRPWKAPSHQEEIPTFSPPPLPQPEPVRAVSTLLEPPAESGPPGPLLRHQPPAVASAKTGLSRLEHLDPLKRAWVASEVFGPPVSLKR